MYRAVALGYWAGEIIDRFRTDSTYDDVRFVFCDTEENWFMSHGSFYHRIDMMGNQDQSKKPLFTPKQIEIIKIGIALKHSDNQLLSGSNGEEVPTSSSVPSSTSKPPHEKSGGCITE